MRKDPDSLVGLGTRSDAGVYKLTDDLAIVQMPNFFTPIVDDPHDFGQIAAANTLSNVYTRAGHNDHVTQHRFFPFSTRLKHS